VSVGLFAILSEEGRRISRIRQTEGVGPVNSTRRFQRQSQKGSGSIGRCGWFGEDTRSDTVRIRRVEEGDAGVPRIGLFRFGSDATRRFPSLYTQPDTPRWHRATAHRQPKRVTNFPSHSRTKTTLHRPRFSSPKAPKLWYTAQPSSHLRQLAHSSIDQQSHGDTVLWTCD
jgi:hypothetical protein